MSELRVIFDGEFLWHVVLGLTLIAPLVMAVILAFEIGGLISYKADSSPLKLLTASILGPSKEPEGGEEEGEGGGEGKSQLCLHSRKHFLLYFITFSLFYINLSCRFSPLQLPSFIMASKGKVRDPGRDLKHILFHQKMVLQSQSNVAEIKQNKS